MTLNDEFSLNKSYLFELLSLKKLAFKMIQTNRLTPNIVTFGCLAYKVTSPDKLEEFLRDLKVTLNIFSRRTAKFFIRLYEIFYKTKLYSILLLEYEFQVKCENNSHALQKRLQNQAKL